MVPLGRRPRVVAAIVVMAVVVALTLTRLDDADQHPRPSAGSVMIYAGHGVSLAGDTHSPAGPGRHPLLVLPVPFGSPATVYDWIVPRLVADGYEVVTYLQRGFRQSQGLVDLAGPATQRDVSTVITWALEHTASNPERVGMLGLSYGGGVSLLAAARDPRIRAVAALSTWTDLDASFDPNNTPSTAAASLLLREAQKRLDRSMLPLLDALGTPRFGPALATIAPPRSPQSDIAQLDKNRPAIFIANGYEDSFFPPAQLVRFVGELTGPKRLDLALGAHGTLASAAPRDPTVVSTPVPDAIAWLDHYVRGVANGVPGWAPIQLSDAATGAVHDYETWPEANAAPIPLGTPNTRDDVGAATAWTAQLTAGVDSGADESALGSGESTAYKPTTTSVGSWRAGTYDAWVGTPLRRGLSIAGTPRVHLRVASSQTTATLFAYLYEVAPSGSAVLVSGEPYTAIGLVPASTRSVSFDLQPTAWTVVAGDRLVLAIDTEDPMYTSPTPEGATITLSSTASDPASITVPTRSS